MTPAEHILKAAQQAIERKSLLLSGVCAEETHEIVIRLKPRGAGWRVSLTVETCEENV